MTACVANAGAGICTPQQLHQLQWGMGGKAGYLCAAWTEARRPHHVWLMQPICANYLPELREAA